MEPNDKEEADNTLMNAWNASFSRRAVVRAAATLALLGILLALPVLTHAAKIILKNGEVIEGHIISETEQIVTVQTLKLTIPLDRSRIASIERGSSSVYEKQMGDEALQLENYEEAIAHYEKAMALGGNGSELMDLINQARRAQEDIELAQYADQVNAARKLLDDGDISHAQIALEELQRTIPETEEAYAIVLRLLARSHYMQAQELRDSIDYIGAEHQLQLARELDPDNASIYIELGDLNALSSRTHRQAIQYFQRGLQLGSKSLTPAEKMRVGFRLGELFRTIGDHARAVHYFQIVYNIDPRYKPHLEENLVTEYKELADSAEATDRSRAVEALKRALAVRPFSADLRYALANNLQQMDETDAAIEQYQRLLEVDPGYRRANYNLALCYMRKGEILKARDSFEKEIEFYPSHYESLVELGDIAMRAGDLEVAKGYFESAHENEPERTQATISLAKIERQLENLEDSRALVQEVLRLSPNDRDANLEMGRILRDEKDYQGATRFFTNVVKLLEKSDAKESEEGRQLMADALIARGEVRLLTTGPGTATGDFREALEIYPDYADAYYKIGEAYKKKYASSKTVSDLKSAEENMLKAREIDPKNPEYALGLGILYHQSLASADDENKAEYMEKAVKNYRDYISNGGRDADTVRNWIKESGGGQS
ncbi:tetratricopeptide repeat protein [bacterium]|nr:tetratricopeptide repeat protein [bacterium]